MRASHLGLSLSFAPNATAVFDPANRASRPCTPSMGARYAYHAIRSWIWYEGQSRRTGPCKASKTLTSEFIAIGLSGLVNGSWLFEVTRTPKLLPNYSQTSLGVS